MPHNNYFSLPFDTVGLGVEGFGGAGQDFSKPFDPFFVLNNSTSQNSGDLRTDPQKLAESFINGQVGLPIYETIRREIGVNDFIFYGKSENINQKLKELLTDSVDFPKIISDFVSSYYGTGGDMIIYRVGSKIYSDTFFRDGKERVGVSFSKDDRQISSYHILSLEYSQKAVRTLKPKDVVHLKYADPFNAVLGITPAIILQPLWNLKWKMWYANQSIYDNGMQAAKLVSLLPEIFDGQSRQTIAEYQKQMEKLENDLKDSTGLYNRNKTWITRMPGIKVDDLQMNNVDMDTWTAMRMIDEQSYIVYSQDPSLFDSKYNKYNDAEIIRDAKSKAIENKIEDLTNALEDFVLPTIYPNYKKRKYPLRYRKTVTNEEIELRDQENQRIQTQIDFLQKAQQSGLNATLNEQGLEVLSRFGITLAEEPTEEEPEEQTLEESTSEQVSDDVTKDKVEEENQAEAEDNRENTSEPDAVRAVDQEELDEVFGKYMDAVNMSASELEEWSENPCSELASEDRSPIERNLRLLQKNKDEWTQGDIDDANETIGFIARMSEAEQGEKTETEDGKTCPSKRDISLKNWAFDPDKRFRNLRKAKEVATGALERQLQSLGDNERSKYPKIQNYGLNKKVLSDQAVYVAKEAFDGDENKLHSADDLIRAFVEVSLYGWDSLTEEKFSERAIKTMKSFNLQPINEVSFNSYLDRQDKINQNLKRFDDLRLMLRSVDVETTEKESEFQDKIDKLENFLQNYYQESLLPIIATAEAELQEKILQIYNDNELSNEEKLDKIDSLLQDKEEELGDKYEEQVDDLNEEAVTAGLATLSILGLSEPDEKTIEEYKTVFKKGYLSNIKGNLSTFFRQVSEGMLEVIGLQNRSAEEDYIQNIKMNRNKLKLSVVTHPRGLFRAVVSKNALKEGQNTFKMLVPSSVISTLAPNGQTANHLFNIKGKEEWADLGSTPSVVDGLGLHHNSQDYYLPIEKTPEQEEISKKQRKQLIDTLN